MKRPLLVLVALSLCLAGCTREEPPRESEPNPEALFQELPLDPKASPLEFRRLGKDTVLVSPGLEAPVLAKFGNFVAAAAKPFERARLTVWDDEDAWRQVQEGEAGGVAGLAERRAEYVKDTAVETYTVFAPDGVVVYERDFRDWPLTDLDLAPLTD